VELNTAYRDSVTALESLQRRGMKLGLERTHALLAALGDPQRGLSGVLVAGTNGKGSVCALLDSMVRAAGLRSVLLTKPHLVSWRERVVVDGEPVSTQAFARLIDTTLAAASRLGPDGGGVTVFEAITAAGIVAAREAQPDVLICEVGLGGRLDSTNVLDLGVAVVTTVAFDHRQQLGDDLTVIAAEKAAIIKPGNHVITAAVEPALTVVVDAAARVGAVSTVVVDGTVAGSAEDLGDRGVAITWDGIRLESPLLGGFQATNLAVAAATAGALRSRGIAIDEASTARGAASVRWPGRMQWIEGRPPLLVDGCHNTAAVRAMVAALQPLRAGRRTVVVFGAMADKDIDDMLDWLRPAADEVVFTAPAESRAVAPAELARRWGGTTRVAASVAEAILDARAIAGPSGLVVACGSLYVAGEALAAAATTGAATGLSAWE
jgi:dihydrofolate synthase/folylpolyglutamate synthase